MPLFTFPRKIYLQRDILDSLNDIISGSERMLVVTDANKLKIHGKRI